MSNLPYEPSDSFPFAKLTLAHPQGLQGGAYFSRMRIGSEPLLIQTPKCSTKNGMHKTEKKIYCDILLTTNAEAFLTWLEKLEERIQNLIYEKREIWFHNDMDYDSIQYHWQPVLRKYRGDKYLLRCFVQRPKNLHITKPIQIFDEDENGLPLEAIDAKARIVSILEVTGLKFTSQSFQLEFCLRQAMILKNNPIFNKCLIQLNKNSTSTQPPDTAASTTQQKGIKEEHTASEEKRVTPTTKQAEAVTEIHKDETTTHTDPPTDTQTVATIRQDHEENRKEGKDGKQKNNTTEQGTGQNTDNEPVNSRDADKDTQHKGAKIENLSQGTKAETTDKFQQNKEESAKGKQKSSNNSKPNSVAATLPASTIKSAELIGTSDNTQTSLANSGDIHEIKLEMPSEEGAELTLKNPNEVYIEIYREARRRAKVARNAAIQAYLEAKRIKTTYLLDEIESSDDEDDIDDYSDNEGCTTSL